MYVCPNLAKLSALLRNPTTGADQTARQQGGPENGSFQVFASPPLGMPYYPQYSRDRCIQRRLGRIQTVRHLGQPVSSCTKLDLVTSIYFQDEGRVPSEHEAHTALMWVKQDPLFLCRRCLLLPSSPALATGFATVLS